MSPPDVFVANFCSVAFFLALLIGGLLVHKWNDYDFSHLKVFIITKFLDFGSKGIMLFRPLLIAYLDIAYYLC